MEHCEEYLEQISAALDGELTSPQREALERHLAQCPDCRALYAAMVENSAALSALGQAEVPPDFTRSVMERVRAESAPKVMPLRRRNGIRRLAGLAACALLCLGVVRYAENDLLSMGSSGSSMDAQIPASTETADFYDAAGAAFPREQSDSAGTSDTKKNSFAADSTEGAANGGSSRASAEEYPFENAAVTPIQWQEEEYPSPAVIRTYSQWEQLLSRLSGSDLEQLAVQYDRAWFENGGQLVAAVVTESSGSVHHELAALYQTADGAQALILRHAPDQGTCDMAAWLITAQTCLPEEAALTVLLQTLSQ